MTNNKESFIESSLEQTPEQAEKNKKHRDSQIKAEKKKKIKSVDNVEQGKGEQKGNNDNIEQCTAKQEAFARQYLVARCKSAAYKYAYDCENMIDNTIRKKALIVYNTPVVYNRIMELQEESNERIDITVDKIKQGYGKLAFTDLPGIVNLNKAVLTMSDFNNLTASQRFCIKKFKVKTEMRLINEVEMKCDFVEVELYDKKSALDSLAKINGMFIEKIENTHKFTGQAPITFGDTSKKKK